jgi:hypothetical protein
MFGSWTFLGSFELSTDSVKHFMVSNCLLIRNSWMPFLAKLERSYIIV